jgi:hypothetical protein
MDVWIGGFLALVRFDFDLCRRMRTADRARDAPEGFRCHVTNSYDSGPGKGRLLDGRHSALWAGGAGLVLLTLP